jgi:hypothetical protein
VQVASERRAGSNEMPFVIADYVDATTPSLKVDGIRHQAT